MIFARLQNGESHALQELYFKLLAAKKLNEF